MGGLPAEQIVREIPGCGAPSDYHRGKASQTNTVSVTSCIQVNKKHSL